MPTAQEMLQAQAQALANAGASREQIDAFLQKVRSNALVPQDLGSLSLSASTGEITPDEFIRQFEANHAQPMLDDIRQKKWAESFGTGGLIAAGAAGGVMEPLAGAAHLFGVETPELDAKINAYRYLGDSSRAAWWLTGVGALAPNVLLGTLVGAVGRGISVGVGASRAAARLIGASTAFGAGYTLTNAEPSTRLFAASLWGLGGAFDIPRPTNIVPTTAKLSQAEMAVTREWSDAKAPPSNAGTPPVGGMGPEAPIRLPGDGIMMPGMGTDASAIPRSRALVPLPSRHFPDADVVLLPGLTRLASPADYLWEALDKQHSPQAYEQHLGAVIAEGAHRRFSPDSAEYAALADETSGAFAQLMGAKQTGDIDGYVDGVASLWRLLWEYGPRTRKADAEIVGAPGISAVGDAVAEAQRTITETMARFPFNPSSNTAQDLVNLRIVSTALQTMKNPEPAVLRYVQNLTAAVNRSLGVLHELPASGGVGGSPTMRFALSADELLDNIQLTSGPQLTRQIAVLSRKYRPVVSQATTLSRYPDLSAASALLKHAAETQDNAGMLYAWGEVEKLVDPPGGEALPITLIDDMARTISAYMNQGLDAAQADDAATMVGAADMLNEGRLILWRLSTLGTNLAAKDAQSWLRRASLGRSVNTGLKGGLGALDTAVSTGVEREAMQIIRQLEGFVTGLGSAQGTEIKQILEPLLSDPALRAHPVGQRVLEMLNQIKATSKGNL